MGNGHVDNFTHAGQPYRMPPQYYRNLGQGRFQELPARGLGRFFESAHSGRGLARLDWNRDGKDDFAVSQLEEPAALVTNTTPHTGHWLQVHLRSVASDRDAIGAEVRLEAATGAQVQQLTAGDGYQASDERKLTFGLGGNLQVSEITIRWPARHVQKFAPVAIDSAWIFIEGRDRPVRLPAE